MEAAKPQRRWYCPTPSWLVYASLLVTAILFLAERWQWFPFNAHKGWTVLVAVAGVGSLLAAMLLWFAVALVFRWQFQFGLRTLLVLTVAVALPFSWLAVDMKKAREQRATMEEIEKEGVICISDWPAWRGSERPEPAWLRNVLGDFFFGDVIGARVSSDAQIQRLKGFPRIKDVSSSHNNQITNVGLACLSDLPQLEAISLTASQITDDGLRCLGGLARLRDLTLVEIGVTDAGLMHVGRLSKLECLWIWPSEITDAGVVHIARLSRLEVLSLASSQVTDSGMKYIAQLRHLQCLWLSHTQITDAGLDCLAGLTELRELHVDETNVTDKGVEKLKQALPNCEIVH